MTDRLIAAADAVMEWWKSDGPHGEIFVELEAALSDAKAVEFPTGSAVEFGSRILPNKGVVLGDPGDGTRLVTVEGGGLIYVHTRDLRVSHG